MSCFYFSKNFSNFSTFVKNFTRNKRISSKVSNPNKRNKTRNVTQSMKFDKKYFLWYGMINVRKEIKAQTSKR